MAQGNRCLGPENLPPCPSFNPKRTKGPSSLILLSEAACGLGGPRAKNETGKRQRWSTFLPRPHNLFAHWNSPLGTGETGAGVGWASQETKQCVKGILQV